MKKLIYAMMAVGLFLTAINVGFLQAVPNVEKEVKKQAGIPALRGQTVVSVDMVKNCITVQDKDGSQQEIIINEKAKIKKGKEPISLSNISAGEKVTIFLKKTTEGTKQASTIMVLKSKQTDAVKK